MCMFLGVCSLQRCSRFECEARAERGCVRGVGGDKEEEEKKKKCLFMGCGSAQGGDGGAMELWFMLEKPI